MLAVVAAAVAMTAAQQWLWLCMQRPYGTIRHGGGEAPDGGSGPGVATGHWDRRAMRQPGDDRMGTVTMETQAAQANHGNW
ncbi:unnamed protein product [Arctogadus glacialis]